MKIDVIQTSFASGEFGPDLYGRTDIAQYANACQLVENMIPRSYGPAISMPGTRYVATVSDSTLRTRLIKFVFNKTDAYAIEMGDRYMRFYTNRGQVASDAVAATEDLSGVTTPIAHWKFNDSTNSTTVLDAIGSHNGTVATGVNTATIATTGIINGCFNFAETHNVAVADHNNFTRTASSQPFSIMAWVYYTPNGTTQGIFSKYDGSSDSEYELTVNSSGVPKATFYSPPVISYISQYTSDITLTTGWHFIVMTFAGDGNSATDCNIYVDTVASGISWSKNSSYTKMANGSVPFKIGVRANSERWADKIDNVAFFHVALTPAQISSLYTFGIYQISTVFRENEIFDVQYTQLNDVIWLTHPNHPTQKLIRTSASEWTISDAPIIGGPFLDNNTPAVTPGSTSASTLTITASATTGTVNITVSPTNASLFTVSGSTLGHHNSYWMIGGLAQTNTTTGLQEMGYVRITYVTNSYTATATVIKNLKVSTATTVWAEGAWSAVRGYPARVTLQERRLWLARTSHEPQKEWGSKVFELEDFSENTQADDDALNLPLASTESNEIQWLAAGKSLIAGTFGGAFITNSGSTEPITPDNANASEEVGFGAEDIAPKKLGNFLYYLQRFGKKLREMYFNFDTDTYKATNRTILSPHILGDGVVDMDVQQNPDTILYCVLTSGTLATLTREVDQEVTAWARHSTNGTYTSIAVIPSQSDDYDEPWVIVERWINSVQKKYVEYFEDIEIPERQDKCLYLHSALSFDAYESSSSSATTISLSASSGSVTLTSSSAYFVGANIGKRIRAIDADGNTLGEGQITATTNTTSLTLSITTTFNALSYAPGYWGVSVSTVAGLSHLEAKTVGILADGITESLTRSVASGVVTLGSNYFVVSVGLSYDQIIYTLPKEAGTQRGTAQGKLQRYSEVSFKVNRSTQDFQYGTDEDNLDSVNLAFTPTTTSLYTGVIPPQAGGLAMRGGYSRGAQIYIKNSNPLPLELLSIMGALETYEK